MNTNFLRCLLEKKYLIIGFTLVHVIYLTIILPTIFRGQAREDVSLYSYWAYQGIEHGIWVGINRNWIYPIGALIPILLAAILGSKLYMLLWFLAITAINTTTIIVLTDKWRKKDNFIAAWYFIIFIFTMGILIFSRLEGITLGLATLALLYIFTKTKLAAFLISIATWIKVWPAALIFSILIAHNKRKVFLYVGAATSATLILLTIIAGGQNYIFSFISGQNSRGIQIEAPIANFWLWKIALGSDESYIRFDHELVTNQIYGSGALLGSHMANIAMFIATILSIALIALKKYHKSDPEQVLLLGGLLLVTVFIFFNKVGSPQFIIWICSPIVAGLATNKKYLWKNIAIISLAIAVLTILIFPFMYRQLLNAQVFAVAIITIRNLLEMILLIYTVKTLIKLEPRDTSQISTLRDENKVNHKNLESNIY